MKLIPVGILLSVQDVEQTPPAFTASVSSSAATYPACLGGVDD